MLLPLLTAGFLAAAVPQAGDTAPDFTVTDTDGKSYTLSEKVKEGPVIVAFFPKAFTPGCTSELTAYRDRYADIEKLKGQVLAVSMDDTETLKKFKDSLKAPFAFIPDPDGKLVKQFDVKTPVMSFAQRYTFVVGEGRKVLRVDSGKDAVDPSSAIAACPLRKQDAKKDPKAPAH
ncbi:Peroxiredoxin [Stigmatella aurantiaca]|uniref:thioredoxin-dependent peroxiredoxin n=1 Tax=Stigmatella aurantiaca TaxID=41 RepID=A0A1H7ZQL7_STIAU|nr:peroxiredoxin [Stigmatella aurantiaca]SEM60932.1 Peroxiredoxin [Stigmatella aurantiaca]